MNSTELRSTLQQLEALAEKAGTALIKAETAHRSALRRAVETGDYTISATTEAALEDARREHSRATTSVEVARGLLAERVKAEKEEAESIARTAIRATLGEMDELARSADEDLARFVGKIRRLKALEVEMHAKARSELGRTPYRAPQANNAFRSIASFATTVANSDSDTLPVRPVVSEAIRDGIKNVEGALS